MSGADLMALLREQYQIELEMAAPNYALAMTSISDNKETFDKLAYSLLDIDSRITKRESNCGKASLVAAPRQILPPYKAEPLEGIYIPLNEAAGMMSLEYIWAYPPGIPFIVPGELLDDDLIQKIYGMLDSGVAIKSTKGRLPAAVYVTSTYL